jgi:hypothetical protein
MTGGGAREEDHDRRGIEASVGSRLIIVTGFIVGLIEKFNKRITTFEN